MFRAENVELYRELRELASNALRCYVCGVAIERSGFGDEVDKTAHIGRAHSAEADLERLERLAFP